jgi:hypothetical protein
MRSDLTRSPRPALQAGDSPRSGCRFELFGTARIAAGVRWVDLELDMPTSLRLLLPILVERCPAVGGAVVDLEGGTLAAGYVLNRNGRDFLKDADAVIQPGDDLLVLSSAAGG